ncbi:MAG: DUF1572 domain-containing protein [Gemmatimonadota bacterium]|nr:DUF1572 domain-containing protein [Gemmatimonadota bacterium]
MSAGLAASIRGMILRELGALARSVELYPDDASLWRTAPGVPNRGGTLVLHCCGNLRHYLGAKLGRSGYVRDRDAEFAQRDVPRAELLRIIERTTAEVDRALSGVDDGDLDGDYPEIIAGHRVAAREYIAHIAVHLAYHLGQLDYHRRFVTGDARSAEAVQAAELPSARPVTAVMQRASSEQRRPGG